MPATKSVTPQVSPNASTANPAKIPTFGDVPLISIYLPDSYGLLPDSRDTVTLGEDDFFVPQNLVYGHYEAPVSGGGK